MYPALQSHCGPEGALLAEHAGREHRELSREVSSGGGSAWYCGCSSRQRCTASLRRGAAGQPAATAAMLTRSALQVDSVLGILLEDHDRLLAGQVGGSGRAGGEPSCSVHSRAHQGRLLPTHFS